MKIAELLGESKGYWHYFIRGKNITIYFNPELPRTKRWNWRDDDDQGKNGGGYFLKSDAYHAAVEYANQLSLQNT